MIWPWTPFEVPKALHSEYYKRHTGEDVQTWEEWEAETKKKYPVRYFLQKTLPNKVGDFFGMFSTAWYWIRTHTYNRYHILDMRCPGYGVDYRWGWCDRSELILIAPFQLLKAFVEEEVPNGVTAWDTEDSAPIHKEMMELYHWWTKGRLEEQKIFNDKIYNHTRSHGPVLTIEELNEPDRRDDEMLARLMKIRGHLWD